VQKLFIMILIVFIHQSTMAQTAGLLDDDFLEHSFQINYGRSSYTGGSSFMGIGLTAHSFSFDSDLHFSYENYLLNELTYALISGNFDYLNRDTPIITHGLMGDASFRWSVFHPTNASVVSAGFAVSNYYISGLSNLISGNYLTAGLSIGFNYAIIENLALFTRVQVSKAYYGKSSYNVEVKLKPLITEIQAILKWNRFSVDYGIIMIDGKSHDNLRVGIWFSLF